MSCPPSSLAALFPPSKVRRGVLIGHLAMLLFASACSRPETPAPVFKVMTYNLGQYGLADRDLDGQANDHKPEDERRAVWSIIAQESPDILAVQEIGNPAVFEEFRFGLKSHGLEYPHVAYLQRGQSELNLALLSRFPIEQVWQHLEDRYTMGAIQLPVLRGFLECDIAITTNYRVRVIVAHLKSKVFHQLGQTEMRRNEARLLNKLVRTRLKENPNMNLVVVGDLNDDPNSAAYREVIGSPERLLVDLRPQDSMGDVWTRFERLTDSYNRIDYILVSPGILPEVVATGCYAVRTTNIYVASDHRPLIASLLAEDRPSVITPASPTPEDLLLRSPTTLRE